MAITIDGVTYRNLQEQVGKNTEDIYDLRKNSARAIVKGETPLEKVHVTGESNLEGPVTAGGPMEVDGPLTVNGPSDVKFKEDNTSLSDKLDKKLGTDGGELTGTITAGPMSIDGKTKKIKAPTLEGDNINGGVLTLSNKIRHVDSVGTTHDILFPSGQGGIMALASDQNLYNHFITISGKYGINFNKSINIAFNVTSHSSSKIEGMTEMCTLLKGNSFAIVGSCTDYDFSYIEIGENVLSTNIYSFSMGEKNMYQLQIFLTGDVNLKDVVKML